MGGIDHRLTRLGQGANRGDPTGTTSVTLPNGKIWRTGGASTPGAQPALWGLLADRFDLHLFPIRRRLIRDPGDDKYTPGARS